MGGFVLWLCHPLDSERCNGDFLSDYDYDEYYEDDDGDDNSGKEDKNKDDLNKDNHYKN